MPERVTRLYGYPVVPKQAPTGGAVQVTNELANALEDAYTRAKVDSGLPVSFVVDTTSRTNQPRDLVRLIAFGSTSAPASAGRQMAERLADAMDRRSRANLLIVSVHGAGARREVVLWAFPKDEAFRFSSEGRNEKIEVVTDIFSQSSTLRKAATFSGQDTRNGFLTGRVRDFQANVADRYVADFWIERFLDSRLEMSGGEGTKLFAKAIRQAFAAIHDDLEAKDVLASAVTLIRGRKQRMTIRKFAESLPSDKAKQAVIDSAPNQAAVDATFDLDPAALAESIRFRLYELEGDVVVKAPFDEVGKSVVIEHHDNDRVLKAEGRVVDESVRTRRG